MGWTLTPLSVVVFVSGAVSLAVAVAALRERPDPMAWPLAVLMIATAGWSIPRPRHRHDGRRGVRRARRGARRHCRDDDGRCPAVLQAEQAGCLGVVRKSEISVITRICDSRTTRRTELSDLGLSTLRLPTLLSFINRRSRHRGAHVSRRPSRYRRSRAAGPSPCVRSPRPSRVQPRSGPRRGPPRRRRGIRSRRGARRWAGTRRA